MDEKKLPELDEILNSDVNDDDLVLVSDVSEAQSKKIKISEIDKRYPSKSAYDSLAAGLTNLDNTSDADKPVSTLIAAALGLKFNISDLDTDNTLAGDSDTKAVSQKAIAAYVANFVDALNSDKYCVLCQEETAGVNGGTFTAGAFRVRVLNKILGTTPSWFLGLTSNRFTLAPNNYAHRWSAPAFYVDNHITALYDYTNTAYKEYGSSEYAHSVDLSQSRSIGSYEGAIVANTAYELRHRCATTKTLNGFGVSGTLAVEKYGFHIIERIGS